MNCCAMPSQLYALVLLFCMLWYVTSQKAPDITCSKYLEFERDGSENIGKITLPNTTSDPVQLDVKVSAPGVLPANEKDRIKLFTDPRATQSSTHDGIPPSYRLEFPELKELPKITSISVNNVAICADEEYAAPSTTVHLEPKVLDPVCGREGFAGPFTKGDYTLLRGQYRWMAAIYHSSEELKSKFKCGGSLISSRTVISAAHCFLYLYDLKPNDLSVLLGQHNITDPLTVGAVQRDVIKLLLHPEYNRKKITSVSDADIAILHLDSIVNFSEYISPICLWSEPSDFNLIHGMKARVAGWGGSIRDGSVTSLPQQVDTTIVTDSECIRQSTAYLRLITNRTICAASLDDSGPCVAFSGNGLMIKRGGIWTLRGITSAGRVVRGKCDFRDYVVYCDIAKHIDWVRENKLE